MSQSFEVLEPGQDVVIRMSARAARGSRGGSNGADSPEGALMEDLCLCQKLLNFKVPHLSPFRQTLVQARVVTDIAVSRELLRDSFLQAVERSTRYAASGDTQDQRDQSRRSLCLGQPTELVCANSLEGWAHIYLTRRRSACDVLMRGLMLDLYRGMSVSFPDLWELMVQAKSRQYL